RRDFKIIEVPIEEYWDLAVNAVTLAPGKVVMNAGSPTVVAALEKEGVEVIQVDFSESHKFAIAGLHCATLELARDPGPMLGELPPRHLPDPRPARRLRVAADGGLHARARACLDGRRGRLPDDLPGGRRGGRRVRHLLLAGIGERLPRRDRAAVPAQAGPHDRLLARPPG